MSRTLFSSLYAEKNSASPTGAWVWILGIYPHGTGKPDVFYFTSNNEPVDYPTGSANTYQPIPMEMRIDDENAEGELPKATLIVGNVANQWTAQVRQHRGFPGGAVLIRLINTQYLSDTTSELAHQFNILSSRVDYATDTIIFDLGNESLFRAPAPREVVTRACRFQYKGTRCGYSGSLTTCDHTLRGPNGCEFHANAVRYGGAPGLLRD